MDLRARCTELIEGMGKIKESERLNALLDAVWRYTMEQHPEAATSVGYEGQNHRWTDRSPHAVESRKKMLLSQKEVLDTIDPESLENGDRLNYELYRKTLELGIEGSRFNDEYLLLGPMGGPHSQPAQTFAMAPKSAISEIGRAHV